MSPAETVCRRRGNVVGDGIAADLGLPTPRRHADLSRSTPLTAELLALTVGHGLREAATSGRGTDHDEVVRVPSTYPLRTYGL